LQTVISVDTVSLKRFGSLFVMSAKLGYLCVCDDHY